MNNDRSTNEGYPIDRGGDAPPQAEGGDESKMNQDQARALDGRSTSKIMQFIRKQGFYTVQYGDSHTIQVYPIPGWRPEPKVKKAKGRNPNKRYTKLARAR
jgi:hypothetical protein